MARIYPTGGIDSEVESVEAEISGGDEAVPFGPRDVELVSSQFRASEEEVLLREEAQNNRESELGYLAAVGKVFGGDDTLLTAEFTNETDIADGATWRFEMLPRTVDRNSEVESAEVLLTTSPL